MTNHLKSWAGRETTLTVEYRGIVEIEVIGTAGYLTHPTTHKKIPVSPENRYYFKTSEGEIIPIYKSGKNRLIVKDGQLVRLSRE